MSKDLHTRVHTNLLYPEHLEALLVRHGVDPQPRTPERLRERAIELRRAGGTIREIARQLGLPVSTTGAWLRNVPVETTS